MSENGNGLVPLASAAGELGITAKTWRNNLSRARAGLPARNLPPVVTWGRRLYVHRKDLDAHLAALGQGNDDGDPELADALEKFCRLFPAEGGRLRELAAGISHKPAPKRKRKSRAALRRVPAPGTTRDQPEGVP